jgi:FemAB-related protein (PEP-CTERM system-associated)
MAAFDGEQPVGALTLFEARHPLFGHYLATAPFGNDGGFHFDHGTARDALQAKAMELADRLNVEYLVTRLRECELDGSQVDRHYRTAVLDLNGGAEHVWSSVLTSKARNHARKGMKEGFSIEVGHDQMDAFVDVFHDHMRDLGSPIHGRRFYESIVRHLGDCSEFMVVRDGTKPVAGALLFWVNGTAMNLHTVALREYNRRCPNYLIYWKMIEASCERGCRWFDMGRSEEDSGNLEFKTNWGSKVVPLMYNYYLRKLEAVPYLDPRNPKYRIPIALWRKTPPFLTRMLGPHLISGLL